MKISYRVKFLDLILFNIYHWLHSPFMLVFFVIILVATSVLNWRSVFGASDEYSLIVKVLTFLALELLFLFVLSLVLLLTVILGNLSNMNKTILTDCVITLGEDSILTESMYARAEYKWNAVQKLARNRSYLFIYVMQHGGLIIPRRAFRGDGEFENVWQECNTRAKIA